LNQQAGAPRRARRDEGYAHCARDAPAFDGLDIQELERVSARWDQIFFESSRAAHERDFDVCQLLELLRDREAWEDVATGSATCDDDAT